ncbi:hypothetical protein D7Z54_22510 [Salibacterium salarium]|uniref:Uncharacterized protein n=1 Tax=Salibacterium salarium TaxID=284579 RepID=A0A3R9RAN7_9BACI|nr:hypothetical protein D7Z54_22510 [Salibacterium salarium]
MNFNVVSFYVRVIMFFVAFLGILPCPLSDNKRNHFEKHEIALSHKIIRILISFIYVSAIHLDWSLKYRAFARTKR